MQFEKVVLRDLNRCYATSSTTIDGDQKILIATEGRGPAFMYEGPTFTESVIWEEPGGTMSMVEIPGRNGDFLAVQNFFPTFDSKEATIVWAHYTGKSWDVKTIMHLPYVHRFDILTGEDGTLYFIGCTLCTSKTDKEDWSDPGKIYVAELPEDLEEPMQLQIIKEGMVKNHGYSRVEDWKGHMAGFVTCDSGIYAVTPPLKKGGAWTIEDIMEGHISDVAVGDIDGDGVQELATIEPFHGTDFCIYHKTESGYEKVYQYPEPMEFGHVVWFGHLRGIPTFIGGQRRHAEDLFMIQYKNGEYVKTTIDTGVGPSNVAVVHEEKRDIIISANRQLGQAVLYLVTD